LTCANHTKLEERHASLRGEKNPNWKGGRRISGDGYILVKLQLADFFYPMARKDGYVLEHRLAMAKQLHRCLLPWEVVHHKNEIKNSNELENLELLASQGKHNTMVNKRVKQLEQTVAKQATQIKLLQWHIKELERVEIESN
ncbi:unnamed protein product, partial [marine sediment metagenome]